MCVPSPPTPFSASFFFSSSSSSSLSSRSKTSYYCYSYLSLPFSTFFSSSSFFLSSLSLSFVSQQPLPRVSSYSAMCTQYLQYIEYVPTHKPRLACTTYISCRVISHCHSVARVSGVCNELHDVILASLAVLVSHLVLILLNPQFIQNYFIHISPISRLQFRHLPLPFLWFHLFSTLHLLLHPSSLTRRYTHLCLFFFSKVSTSFVFYPPFSLIPFIPFPLALFSAPLTVSFPGSLPSRLVF